MSRQVREERLDRGRMDVNVTVDHALLFRRTFGLAITSP
jgi:hypothetical protein